MLAVCFFSCFTSSGSWRSCKRILLVDILSCVAVVTLMFMTWLTLLRC